VRVSTIAGLLAVTVTGRLAVAGIPVITVVRVVVAGVLMYLIKIKHARPLNL
jgi:hypothetical protein